MSVHGQGLVHGRHQAVGVAAVVVFGLNRTH